MFIMNNCLSFESILMNQTNLDSIKLLGILNSLHYEDKIVSFNYN